MNRHIHKVLVGLVAVLAVACGNTEVHINVGDDQIEGLWQRNASQEYWRYKAEVHTGVTWDEAEDISEEESNLTFTWTVSGDRLTHIFKGRQGNQAVPKVYTIKEISSSAMRWEDDYGMSYKFTKVN